jgi:ABC-type nitrate/sulfonate/bicarbonate transport system permease component
MTRRLRVLALELWLPVVLVAAWWVLSADSDSFYFPPLETILQKFRETFLSSNAGEHLGPSLAHLGLGFLAAAVVGVGAGLLIGLNRWASATLDPLVHFFRALPGPALLPFAIIAFGIGAAMKVWIIAFAAVFPILLNTVDGVRSADPLAGEVARAYRLRRRREIFAIVLPGASPQIMAGLRVGLQTAILLMVVSELVASTDGLGFFILQSQQQFDIANMWAGIIALGLLGYILNGAFGIVERRVLRWYVATHGEVLR